jgi:uncharacterized protein YndB with AHSA1/START domain
MSNAKKDDDRRLFEMTMDIDATPDDVWRALTEAEELVRWFPLQARVTPGEGGTMLWAWKDAWRWETRIAEWIPGKRLRLVDEAARPYDANGQLVPADRGAPAQVVMDFQLEARGNTTRLRLVHSGFGRGDAWDDELDGVARGWQFELRSLKQYLERHRGRQRHYAWIAGSTPTAIDDTWAALTGVEGFNLRPSSLTSGTPFTIATPAGDNFSGVTEFACTARDFAGRLSEFEDTYLRLSVFRAGGRTGITAWMATYSAESAAAVKGFEPRAQAVVDGLAARAAREG